VVTPSLGISTYPDHEGDANALILAHKARYHAAQAGRNTCRFDDDAMRS
jgi:GGDEF domain-containing protein